MIFLCVAVLGFELRASHLLGKNMKIFLGDSNQGGAMSSAVKGQDNNNRGTITAALVQA
jgi:hypothetical protein